MSYIRKMPLSISGLALGLVALGNLLGSYSQNIRYLFGAISALIIIALIIRIFTDFTGFLGETKQPLTASVFATVSMAIILLSAYLAPYAFDLARLMWLTGIILHMYFVIQFTIEYVLSKRDIKTVFPSWFIVYVGVVVASNTAPAFEQLWIGQAAFWFGFITYFVLLPFVFYRVYKIKEIPGPAMANIAIICAPASLLLAGYASSFPNGSIGFLVFLIIFSQLLYVFVLLQLPKILKRHFLPSYSAFTFPFVISALGLKLANGVLIESGIQIEWLSGLVFIEEIIATVFVLFVLVGFVRFVFSPGKELVKGREKSEV